MAQQLSVLVVVDVRAARETGSLDHACYLYDNNRSGGSTGQGTTHLVSALVSSQVLNWAVLPLAMLAPDEPLPIIEKIDAVLDGGEGGGAWVMIPSEYDSPDLYSEGRYWSGTIVPGRAGTFPYTIHLGWRDTPGSLKRGRPLPPPMTVTASIRILSDQQLSTPLGKRLVEAMSGGARP